MRTTYSFLIGCFAYLLAISTPLHAFELSEIPKTISPEAQDYIRAHSPIVIRSRSSLMKAREVFAQAPTDAEISQTAAEHGVRVKAITVANLTHHLIIPDNYDKANDGKLIFFVHGGGFMLGHTLSALPWLADIAKQSGYKLVSLYYSLVPESPSEQGAKDLLAAYQVFLKKYKRPDMIWISAGAGANLSLQMFQKLDKNADKPRHFFMFSPWVDLSDRGDSRDVAYLKDPIIAYNVNLEWAAKLYTQGHEKTDPRFSPLFGKFDDTYPATTLITGTRDVLLSDSARLQDKLLLAGNKSEIYVMEGMWHGFHILNLPESKRITAEMSKEIKRIWATQ